MESTVSNYVYINFVQIPASAVEMPGHRSTNKVDVQFGNWEYEASSFGFGNGESVVSSLTSSVVSR